MPVIERTIQVPKQVRIYRCDGPSCLVEWRDGQEAALVLYSNWFTESEHDGFFCSLGCAYRYLEKLIYADTPTPSSAA